MKTNITLELDAGVLREGRILALEELVRERKGYERARRRALARLRDSVDLGWRPPTSRDELLER